MCIRLTLIWLYCQCNLCSLSLERCCRHGEVTWQLRKTCTDKPFLCQALHIIVNSIIVAPQADKMKNISHKNNLSTNNILWATTYRLPILPIFYLISNDWMFFLACLFFFKFQIHHLFITQAWASSASWHIDDFHPTLISACYIATFLQVPLDIQAVRLMGLLQHSHAPRARGGCKM